MENNQLISILTQLNISCMSRILILNGWMVLLPLLVISKKELKTLTHPILQRMEAKVKFIFWKRRLFEEKSPISLFSVNYAPELKCLICRVSYLSAWSYQLFLVVVTDYEIPTVVYNIGNRYLLKYLLPLHLLSL